MKKPDKEYLVGETTRYDRLPRLLKLFFIAVTVVGMGAAIFRIFSLSFQGQVFLTAGYYYFMFGLFGTCCFLVVPARREDKVRFPWYDLLAAALMFGISGYFFLSAWQIMMVGVIFPTPLQFVLALIYCLLALEAGRRSGGPLFMAVVGIFGIIPLFAGKMPGIFYGQQLPFTELIAYYTFSDQGLLGLTGSVLFDLIIGFLIFSAMLSASGAGQFFLDLAKALMGGYRGGPAKVSVIASGFFGSLSGSALSNVVATGTFTIPAMKQMGYPAYYAGAVEACASTGGIIMPPVMGTLAFVMSTLVNVPYSTIMLAAALPAILYYYGLALQVDAHAALLGLKGMPRDQLPGVWSTLKKGWPYLTVLVFLTWGLLYLRWEYMTPFYACGLLFVLSFSTRETMMTPKRLLKTTVEIGKLLATITAIMLPVGILIASLVITGVTNAATSALIFLGGGNLYVVLLIGVALSFLLGMMGLGIANYLFLAISLAPALVSLGGLNLVAVHLFIIYYTMIGLITPPVATAAFLAAAMAGASPLRTAWQATRLGVVVYFVPFFFLFKPALILQGPVLEAVYLFVLSLVGILFVAGGVEGYLLKVGRLPAWARPPLALGGFLIALPEWNTTFLGAAMAAVVITVIALRKKAAVRAAAT